MYLQEGEVGISVKVCNLQVAMDDLAAGVEQLQGLIVIFQAGGQGQLHVCTQAHCNRDHNFILHIKYYLKLFSLLNIHAIVCLMPWHRMKGHNCCECFYTYNRQANKTINHKKKLLQLLKIVAAFISGIVIIES